MVTIDRQGVSGRPFLPAGENLTTEGAYECAAP